MDVAVQVMESKFITDEQFELDIFPVFMRHLHKEQHEARCDIKMSQILARFVHNIPLERSRADKQFRNYVVSYLVRVTSKEPEQAPIEVRKGIAFNLPCFYKYFGRQESYSTMAMGDSINFAQIYTLFTDPNEDNEIKVIIGRGIHEVIKEAEAKARNPFMFKSALSNLLKSETVDVYFCLIPSIGTILHSLVKHL